MPDRLPGTSDLVSDIDPVLDRYADLQEVFDKVAEEAAKSDEDVKREQEEAAAEAAKERARDDRALVLRSTGSFQSHYFDTHLYIWYDQDVF